MSRPILSISLAFLLLAPLLSMGGLAQTPEPEGTDLVIEDPAGDIRTNAFLTGTETGAPLDHVDIRALRIGSETPSTFQITFDLEGWDDTTSPAIEQGSVNGMSCRIGWNYGEGLDYSYTVYARQDGQEQDGTPLFTSSLSFSSWEGDRYNYDYTYQGTTVLYDAVAHTVTVTIDKAFVPSFPGPDPLGKGTDLKPLYGVCATDTALLVYHYDQVDVQGKSYAFVEEGAGSVVRVGFGMSEATPSDLGTWQFPEDGTGSARTSIAPGQQSLVPVRLENRIDEKRLVILTARVLDGGDGWNTTIAPSIFLKGGETRTVNLIVTPPPGAALGTSAEVEVRAEVAGAGGTGTTSQRLVVAPQLSADNNVLHIHAEPYDYGMPLELLFPVLPGHMLRMSLLEEEEGFSNEPFGPGPVSSLWSTMSLEALGRPVRLAEEPASLELTIVGDAGAALNVELRLGEANGGTLYSVWDSYEVGTHTIPLTPLYEGQHELPAGARLYGDLYVTQGERPLEAKIDPKGTRITLPVRDVQAGLNVTDGRFLPNLALGQDEDKVTYLNPGKEYAFDLLLSNDGVEEDDLRVTVTAENATGWTIDVLPGARFRVPAGESTPVTIDVIAPADAKEGDTTVMKVEAISKHDARAHASITLSAVVTTGVDVEEKPYAEKEDQLAPLADEEKGSPGPFALLAILAALGFVLRRREH